MCVCVYIYIHTYIHTYNFELAPYYIKGFNPLESFIP